MQEAFSWAYKGVRKCLYILSNLSNMIFCKILFYGQNVQYESFRTTGLPYVSIAFGGKCKIGKNLIMNNKLSANPIGCMQPCVFFVDKDAELIIGDNVGISQASLVCHQSISIGNYVKIGGGVCIYDTDFHSLDAEIRKDPYLDTKNKVKSPVVIKDNAFIGAHSTILKGVTVGRNSVVGACSVVTKDVPDNEIWAGNPAKRIKAISPQEILQDVSSIGSLVN